MSPNTMSIQSSPSTQRVNNQIMTRPPSAQHLARSQSYLLPVVLLLLGSIPTSQSYWLLARSTTNPRGPLYLLSFTDSGDTIHQRTFQLSTPSFANYYPRYGDHELKPANQVHSPLADTFPEQTVTNHPGTYYRSALRRAAASNSPIVSKFSGESGTGGSAAVIATMDDSSSSMAAPADPDKEAEWFMRTRRLLHASKRMIQPGRQRPWGSNRSSLQRSSRLAQLYATRGPYSITTKRNYRSSNKNQNFNNEEDEVVDLPVRNHLVLLPQRRIDRRGASESNRSTRMDPVAELYMRTRRDGTTVVKKVPDSVAELYMRTRKNGQ